MLVVNRYPFRPHEGRPVLLNGTYWLDSTVGVTSAPIRTEYGGTVTRAPMEIAESLYTNFEQSSQTFQYELQPNSYGGESKAKPFVDAAIAALVAAMGPDQKEVAAVAGLTPEGQGEVQECEMVVFSNTLLLHSEFAIASTLPVVKVTPRSAVKSLTIVAAPTFRQPRTPLGLRFTVEYEDGLVLRFPLKRNTPTSASTLADVLDAVRADLENKA